MITARIVLHPAVSTAILLLNIGCEVAQSPPKPGLLEPGPESLRNDTQMESFLLHCPSWIPEHLGEDEPAHHWAFSENGTFVLCVDNSAGSDLQQVFPAAISQSAQEIRGRWECTMTTLTLTEVRTASGKQVEPFSLPLEWMDGKLYIEIGGIRYSGNDTR